MKLILTEHITTRYQVQQLAEANPDVTEIDWNGKESYGASGLDEMLRRFPDAKHVGVSPYTQHEMAWILRVTGRENTPLPEIENDYPVCSQCGRWNTNCNCKEGD